MDVHDPGLHRVLDAVPDAIVAMRSDGRIAFVNTRAERLFGRDRAALAGEQFDLLVGSEDHDAHAPDSDQITSALERQLAPGLVGRRADGSRFPAEVSLGSVPTDGGTLFLATVRDVTERLRAEVKFRGLLEAAPDAFIGVGRDGRILLANAQAEALFGYRREELIGANVELLVPEAARAAHPAHRERYFADPRTRPMGAGMQLAGRRKDGTTFPAEISLSHIETEEGIVVTAAIRDVSERIEAQRERDLLAAQHEQDQLRAQLNQSRRLESLGQLAGGVAHDFNNLLGVILGYASFVSETLGEARGSGLPPEQVAPLTHDVDQIASAARRAATLTRQLLTFSRRESIRLEVFDLNDVVRDVETLLKRTIGEHVRLRTVLAPDLGSIEADKGQMEQVLVNLAVNARDAMPRGGHLTIDTANLDVDAEYALLHPGLDPGPHIRLRVSDTGVGMTQEVMDRAFEPFFTTKPTGEGTGLGLATVYGIVTQLRGSVRLYSERGVGTTVTILLPAAGATPGAMPAVAPRPRAAGGEVSGATILLVEDEDALREVTRRILEGHGYRVLAAAGGHEAIDIAEQHEGAIDLVLTDVVMPNIGGREVADCVVALRPGIRVLYMSGYAEPVIASQGTLDQDASLVTKPFSSSMLLAKLRETLEAPPPAPA